MSERAVEKPAPSARAAWFAVVAPIVAWLVHLTTEASLVQHTCTSSGTQWPMHAVTAVCVAVTLSAMAVALRMAQTPEGPWRFIGLLGLILAAANLVLILLEGSYVLFIKACA
jgi:hypothetical protein